MILVWVTCDYQEVWEALPAAWSEVAFFEKKKKSSLFRAEKELQQPKSSYIWRNVAYSRFKHIILFNFLRHKVQAKLSVTCFQFQVKADFQVAMFIFMAQTQIAE